MKSKLIYMRFFILILLFFNIIDLSLTENVKKSVDDNREDNGETGDDGKDESMEIPEPEPANVTCTRRQNSQMHEIRAATHKQFPFMAALMSQQNEYLCAGSIVSHGLILTTAKCSLQPINYVLVNTTSDKKDDTTVSLHVIKSEKFPSYTGSESIKDVALIYTEKHNKSIASKINLSNVTEMKADIGLEALGFGLNADVGKAKELQYIGVEVRVTDGDKLEAYIDCIDTKVPTCFKDTGGPVIMDNQLFGIVVKGSTVCSKEISSAYAVNKRVVDILPTYTFVAWLDEKIRKNEEQEPVALEVYPAQPAYRRTSHVMTSSGHNLHYFSIYALIFVSALQL
ncbi:trypsin-like [Epargyreus clarus]|uniref:trypsin-like n=1 Tax=Epargyreus clarus TaxID=520877 RepID=UPI003C2E8D8C